MLRRPDQTQKAEAEVTTTAGQYADVDALDLIDASPTKTNTLLYDLMELECRAFEQYHQLPPPPLARASEYLAVHKLGIPMP
jgi:hypothetical protein